MTTKAEKPPNLAQRMLAITRDIGSVDKAGKAPAVMGGFDYIKADDVATAVKAATLTHGVIVLWTIASQSTKSVTFKTAKGERHNFVTEVELELRFINSDDPEDTLSMRSLGHGIDPSDKAPGKAVTYALKTAYIGLFHLKGQADNEAEDSGEMVAPASTTPLTDEERENFKADIHFAENADELGNLAKQLKARNVQGSDRKELMALWTNRRDELKEAA